MVNATAKVVDVAAQRSDNALTQLVPLQLCMTQHVEEVRNSNT